jgi:hypothetical protein
LGGSGELERAGERLDALARRDCAILRSPFHFWEIGEGLK